MIHFSAKHTFTIHVVFIVCIFLVLLLCMVYPFLPGEHDLLAVPLSVMVQVLGPAGIPLTVLGILWLLFPKHQFVFAIIATVIVTMIALFLALIGTLSIGKAVGMLILFIWIYSLYRSIPAIKNLKIMERKKIHPAPLYLVTLPLLILLSQLLLMEPVSKWSKRRAIENAKEFIQEIETYRQTNGHYPMSLHAQHKDYLTNVVGVEKYYYAQQGDSYNLSFEQPRFLLDRIGTREWVVYNPSDAQRFYSHTAWMLLPPGAVDSAQGWYASGETGYLHWKYFLLD